MFWKKKKEVKVTPFEGRRMKLTLLGINEFERVTGVNILAIDDLKVLTPREIGVLIWACLIWEDPALKIADIPALIEPVDGNVLIKSLAECITDSFPEASGQSSPLVASQNPLTGSDSGALPSTTSKSPKFLSGD
jgi:hypothetical protein